MELQRSYTRLEELLLMTAGLTEKERQEVKSNVYMVKRDKTKVVKLYRKRRDEWDNTYNNNPTQLNERMLTEAQNDYEAALLIKVWK